MHEAAGFVKGWLDGRGISVHQEECRGLPVLTAEAGDPDGRVLILHGHLDVVPAESELFEPRVDGERLIGRGTYDMKAALAAMLMALPGPGESTPGILTRIGIVGDEESEESDNRGSDFLVDRGLTGEFAITGEPTDLHIGVAAKGVLALRVSVAGRSAHGSTPWLGDNAILRAIEMFRGLESLPFARESSEHFDRPSINLGRIQGGDALNRVPDRCTMDVDIRYLPNQDPSEIESQIRDLEPEGIETIITLPPIDSGSDSPWVETLGDAIARHHEGPVTSVGRDGASDALSFIRAGIPAVEFGPTGAGHHGPEEWVSIPSLEAYLSILRDFISAAGADAPGQKAKEDR